MTINQIERSPMNDNKEQDIRVIRSKAWLLDALIELLKEKDYKDITIKELTDEASVSRQTFYRNFKDKDDILLQNMDEAFDGFFSRIKDNLSRETNLKDIAGELFITWKENRNLFTALEKAGLMHKTLERFSEYSTLLQKQIGINAKKNNNYDKYLAHFIAGGTYMILEKWFQDKMKVQVSDISELYDKILRFFIDTTRS